MKKWMYVVIGVVVVVGVVLAVRLAPERSPVDNGAPAPNGDIVNGVPNGNDDGLPDVAAATSMRFSVEVTNGETMGYTYMAKDIGTDDLKLRMETWWNGTEEGIIINGQLRKIWHLEDRKWIEDDMANQYWDMFWTTWTSVFEGYRTTLFEWTQGDWSYTDPYSGYSVKIYDVQVDPNLSDGLFAP